jgi:hypothetical protein
MIDMNENFFTPDLIIFFCIAFNFSYINTYKIARDHEK